MGTFSIEELSIPVTLSGAAGADFIEMTRVRNDIEAHTVGNYDLACQPAELLPTWLDPYEQKRMFVARVDGRIVGRGTHELQSGDAVTSAWLSVEVLPEFRRRGIGSALFERVAQIAISEGRSAIQSFAVHGAAADGERIESPTGFGSVPADDDGTRFLLARGFRLAQVDRMSRLSLPAKLPRSEAAPGYVVERWEGATPENRLADLAILHARMSTDPPLGEVDYQPEEWDEARVLSNDERNAAEGRRWLTAAARHVASDTLVGFTQLSLPRDASRPVFQQDTVVIQEHRGHRLGMLIKVANLRRLAEIEAEIGAGYPAVYTWNAEENLHMLRVNEAIGFVPVGYEGSWKKTLR